MSDSSEMLVVEVTMPSGNKKTVKAMQQETRVGSLHIVRKLIPESKKVRTVINKEG